MERRSSGAGRERSRLLRRLAWDVRAETGGDGRRGASRPRCRDELFGLHARQPPSRRPARHAQCKTAGRAIPTTGVRSASPAATAARWRHPGRRAARRASVARRRGWAATRWSSGHAGNTGRRVFRRHGDPQIRGIGADQRSMRVHYSGAVCRRRCAGVVHGGRHLYSDWLSTDGFCGSGGTSPARPLPGTARL